MPIILAVFCCIPAHGEVGAADAEGTQEPGAAGRPADGAYGRTPATVVPYRNLPEPYARFFQAPVPFRGTGRDKMPRVQPTRVRIGFLGPGGSAPDAARGKEMLDGFTLALEQANAGGGYDGLPFEGVVHPDVGQWGSTANVLVQFAYEDDVLAVLGSIDGASTHVALRVALKTELPMVNTGTTDPTLTETNIPWLLRCMADDRQQGYALATHIFRECGLERVVAMRSSDRYGRMGIGEFRDAARRLGRPLLAELQWSPGEKNFAAHVDRIAALAPEAVVLWGNATDAGAIVQAMRTRGMPVRVFGSDRLASRAFLIAAGDASNGVVAAATYDPEREDAQLAAFVAAFTTRFGHAPGTFAAHAYDGTNILIEAIRTAGLNRARLRDVLFAYREYAGVTGRMVFDATLNDIGPVYLATVVYGRFTYREVNVFAQAEGAEPETAYRTLLESAPIARIPSAAPAVAPSAYRLGAFLPLTEPGQAAVRGMRRALADDAARNPTQPPVELIVRDARGAWGNNTTELVDLVTSDAVLAVIGSTERRGTHVVEMLAAKLHFPVVSLCGTDPTITSIPLPWVFDIGTTVVPTDTTDAAAVERLAYDAAAVLVARIRAGADTRPALRDALSHAGWYAGETGTFRFDPLGRRLDRSPDRASAATLPAAVTPIPTAGLVALSTVE